MQIYTNMAKGLLAQVEWVEADQLATDAGIAGLAKRMNQLQQTVADLSVTVGVLTAMLAERGQLDAAAIEQRVASERAAVHATMASTVTCDRCGQRVPGKLTVITASGTLCDRCAAQQP